MFRVEILLLVFALLLHHGAAMTAPPTKGQIFSDTTKYPLPNQGNVAAHDPNIVEYNNSFYLFHGGVHIIVDQASSLDGPWTKIGTVLDGASVIEKDNRTRPWSPTTIEWNGKFYCFYAISMNGSRNSAIGVATSDTIDSGNWTDHGALINTEEGNLSSIYPYSESNAIDPSFMADNVTGKPYLIYGSYWHGIFQVPLDDDLLSVKDPKHPNATNVVYDAAPGAKPEEGSWMSYREPYYYLWFSHGKCCGFNGKLWDFPSMGSEYSIRVGRSTDLNGPFMDKDGVLLTEGGGTIVYGSNRGVVYAPGGIGVLPENDKHGDILYYHYLNTSIGFTDIDAQLGWNHLNYDDGWPVAIAGDENSGAAVRPNYIFTIFALIVTYLLLRR